MNTQPMLGSFHQFPLSIARFDRWLGNAMKYVPFYNVR